jgi:hypothetical protein
MDNKLHPTATFVDRFEYALQTLEQYDKYCLSPDFTDATILFGFSIIENPTQTAQYDFKIWRVDCGDNVFKYKFYPIPKKVNGRLVGKLKEGDNKLIIMFKYQLHSYLDVFMKDMKIHPNINNCISIFPPKNTFVHKLQKEIDYAPNDTQINTSEVELVIPPPSQPVNELESGWNWMPRFVGLW